MAIYSLSGGMKRIDVPENHVKNNLPIGTVLQMVGYENSKYVIVENLGISERFPAHGAMYKTINLDNGHKSQREALGLDHISTKADDRIKMYYTDKVLSADEIMDTVNFADRANDAAIKEKHAKEQARAAELTHLLASYKHLKRVFDYREQKGKYRTTYAVGAANVRLELQAAFPGVKFSIKSEGYSIRRRAVCA